MPARQASHTIPRLGGEPLAGLPLNLIMASFTHHVFICTNTRPAEHPRGCCNADGAATLRERFKDEIARRHLKTTVRANTAGCLDQCEHGPTVVVYPEGVWYGLVRPEDVQEIVECHFLAGRPVERLRIKPECINTKACEHKPRRGGAGASP